MQPRVYLSGFQILCNKIVTKNFKLNGKKRFLLMGVVYNPYGFPMSDAAVEITLADVTKDPPVKDIIGITFTERDGSYAVSLPVTDKEYIIKAYSS